MVEGVYMVMARILSCCGSAGASLEEVVRRKGGMLVLNVTFESGLGCFLLLVHAVFAWHVWVVIVGLAVTEDLACACLPTMVPLLQGG